MKIGVIGAGAIGMFVSAKLSKSHDVTCYVRRDEQRLIINDEGIRLNDQTYRVASKLFDNLKNEDLLIICLKQTHLDSALKKLSENHPDTPMLFLQNGLSHIDKIKSLSQPILIGTCEHGVLRVSDYEVRHKGEGRIYLSAFEETTKELAKERISPIIDGDDFPVIFKDDLMSMLYEKLVINSVINPITALFQVENGKVLSNSHLKEIAYNLTVEGCEVLNLDENHMWKRVQQVAEHTSSNFSSMVYDIQKGNETEIESMNGYLLNISDQELPNHELIYHLIKAKEIM
ncbi:hypothetical protein CEY16_01865 [Halalkalibacillus sediminis]|uniref:2-dehydropantoate 2-reductase n=1 Tax=Halalkalibacillus sediminis TaxID=2018042 RepID=A0A2I0QW16_9BACI|nr:2-dehydropantoate 2-reductase [Halalkalibacillus sediminis]PKR78527.1 hypothetical protein CEY16_01865 [Halalkalibacillus sediminis]